MSGKLQNISVWRERDGGNVVASVVHIVLLMNWWSWTWTFNGREQIGWRFLEMHRMIDFQGGKLETGNFNQILHMEKQT